MAVGYFFDLEEIGRLDVGVALLVAGVERTDRDLGAQRSGTDPDCHRPPVLEFGGQLCTAQLLGGRACPCEINGESAWIPF
jgi:hypothetical protein